jgi:hypothetical protein
LSHDIPKENEMLLPIEIEEGHHSLYVRPETSKTEGTVAA